MHDLIPLGATLPGTLTEIEITATLGYAANATAESTRAAYDADQAAFRHWCTARGLCPLPASPASVAAYLASLADAGRKAAGIGRACAGIAASSTSWHQSQPDRAPGRQANDARNSPKNRL